MLAGSCFQAKEKIAAGNSIVTASVKMILFSYSNEDTKDKERRKGWVVEGPPNVVPSAKPIPCPRTTPQQVCSEKR
jgi:hypothetical protein